MNKARMEKIFNPTTLLFANIAIIAATEFTGQLFFRLGIIHIVAILFIALSVIRIFVRYYSYDPILEKFFQASLGALFVFTLSHIVEYFSMGASAFAYYSDSVLINTVNFYLISLMLVIIGAETFLRIKDSRSAIQIKGLIALIFLLVISIFVFTTKTDLVSLELDKPEPYVYMALILIFGLIALKKTRMIGKHVSISTAFTNFLTASIILTMLSAAPYILYDLLEKKFGIPLFQIMYLSHFFFYASLSLFFLAFGRIKIAGGVYKNLEKIQPTP